MYPSNPLKRPSPNDEDPELSRLPKRLLRPTAKPRPLNDSEVESRHFLMISTIKNIIPKTNKPILIDQSIGHGTMGTVSCQQQLHDQMLREKQRQAQQELELYRQQMRFYSEECWLWGSNDCSKDQ